MSVAPSLGWVALDMRLVRHAPVDADARPEAAPPGEFRSIPAGFRVQLAHAPALVEAIKRVAQRASPAALRREPTPALGRGAR